MKHLLLLAALLTSGHALAFNTLKYGWTGDATITWAAGDIPVPWYLHPNGCADTGFDKARQAIQAAFQSWQDVGCSTISFSYEGTASSAPSSGRAPHRPSGARASRRRVACPSGCSGPDNRWRAACPSARASRASRRRR